MNVSIHIGSSVVDIDEAVYSIYIASLVIPLFLWWLLLLAVSPEHG